MNQNKTSSPVLPHTERWRDSSRSQGVEGIFNFYFMKYVITINQGVLHEMGMIGKIKANHVAVMDVIAGMVVSNFEKRVEGNTIYVKTWYKTIASELSFFDLSTHRIRQIIVELEQEGFIVRHKDNQREGCLFLSLGPSYIQYKTSLENYQGVVNKLTRGRQKINDNHSTINPNTNPTPPEKEFSETDSQKFVRWFMTLSPEKIKKSADEKKWQLAYDQLIKKGYSKKEIADACEFGRTDRFWQGNFYSPAKLLKKDDQGITYIDLFLQKIEIEKKKLSALPKHAPGEYVVETTVKREKYVED